MSMSKQSWTGYYKKLFPLQDRVLEICKNLEFKWEEIIDEAGQKRLVEEIFVVECLRTFQYEKLSNIKWIQQVNVEDFKSDSQIIIENIITKGENKLFKNKTLK